MSRTVCQSENAMLVYKQNTNGKKGNHICLGALPQNSERLPKIALIFQILDHYAESITTTTSASDLIKVTVAVVSIAYRCSSRS